MFRLTRLLAAISLCASLLVSPVDGFADESNTLGTIANHDHSPIQVRSKPVIERLPVKVIEPIDVKLSNDGLIFVADRAAACVFRLDEHGSVSIMIDQLPDIQRIHVDADNSLYVLTSTGGESSLHQITMAGQHVVLERFSFAATAFVRDSVGQFILSVRNSGRLVSLSADGVVSNLTELTLPATDLVYNAGGQLEVLLGSGHLVRVDADGKATPTGFAPPGSTRLTSLEDGSLLALAGSAAGRSQVVYVSRDVEERPEQFEVSARVPAGTAAVGFDSLGNLCLANPDLRAVTRVTSQFLIPCPHCGRPTRMIFNADAEPGTDKDSRSF